MRWRNPETERQNGMRRERDRDRSRRRERDRDRARRGDRGRESVTRTVVAVVRMVVGGGEHEGENEKKERKGEKGA